MPQFDGVGILWMLQVRSPDKIAASDACLKGLGAVSDTEFLKAAFPEEWIGSNIANLELLAVIVMCKCWIEKFRGKAVCIRCDNEAVANILNTGRARDSTLIMLMREMVYIAAGVFEFRGVYWPGRVNVLPDLLSRWAEGSRVHNKFRELVKGKNFVEIEVAPEMFEMWHTW